MHTDDTRPVQGPVSLDTLLNCLRDAAQAGTLTEQELTRGVLAAYELGVTSGRGEAWGLLTEVRAALDLHTREMPPEEPRDG